MCRPLRWVKRCKWDKVQFNVRRDEEDVFSAGKSTVGSALFKLLRRGNTGKRKIYSDSTLRNANQLAFITDIACMPGEALDDCAMPSLWRFRKQEESSHLKM